MDSNDSSSTNKQTGNDKQDAEQHRVSPLEKIFTALSLILLIVVAGYLIRQATTDDTPPSFKLKVHPAEKRGASSAVEVSIFNQGSLTAKAVNVSSEVPGPDGKPVTAEASADWVPGNSERKVTLIFPSDADTSAPEVFVTGYEQP